MGKRYKFELEECFGDEEHVLSRFLSFKDKLSGHYTYERNAILPEL